MHTDEEAEVVRRLHSAAGHLNAVIHMADSGQRCEKVLHQLNAVEGAIHAAALRLLKRRLRESEATILASRSPARRAEELKRLQSLYSMIHIPNQDIEATK